MMSNAFLGLYLNWVVLCCSTENSKLYMRNFLEEMHEKYNIEDKNIKLHVAYQLKIQNLELQNILSETRPIII